MTISRRAFMGGMVGCSAAIAAMAGGRVGNLAFAGEAGVSAASDETLVIVFLRGGCDGLSLVAPYNAPQYTSGRGKLAVPAAGANKALDVQPNNASYDGLFGLHPKAKPLQELYVAGKLAIVHACGLQDDTRSHFDAMDYIERGTPGNKSTGSGWLTRHLRLVGAAGVFPSLAAGSALPSMLLADRTAVSMVNAGEFGLGTHWRYGDKVLDSVGKLYSGGDAFGQAGKRTVEALRAIAAIKKANGDKVPYGPVPGSAYPDHEFGESLQLVAQMIKLEQGLRAATVDFGGWDTHESQGDDGAGYFATQVDVLARGLQAFFNDLPNHQNRLTVVVMSEFGRRLGANTGGGTDHGHGNAMLVLGGNVNGGKFYGRWPGLEDLDQSQDLRITTDYRAVLSDILVRRLGNPDIGKVFPGIDEAIYPPAGMGIVKAAGSPLPPNYAGTEGLFVPLVAR